MYHKITQMWWYKNRTISWVPRCFEARVVVSSTSNFEGSWNKTKTHGPHAGPVTLRGCGIHGSLAMTPNLGLREWTNELNDIAWNSLSLVCIFLSNPSFYKKLFYPQTSTLQGINISHLGKRKIIDSKVPAGMGYVRSQEGKPLPRSKPHLLVVEDSACHTATLDCQ